MKCVICQRRDTDGPQCCRSCPLWLDGLLVEIVELYALAPAAVVPSCGAGPKVSGSREAPVPARLDVVDLIDRARPASAAIKYRYDSRTGIEWAELGGDPDQIGFLPIATELDFWVRDWIANDWCPGDHLPPPTVSGLAGWLRVRLDAACDHHPAIDEFATKLRAIRSALQRALGSTRHSGEPIGACPIRFDSGQRCGATLYAEPYVDRIACPRCGTSWPRVKWLALAAGMQDVHTDTEEAA